MLLSAFIQGIAIGFGLIIAIGPQNACLIQQGVRRQHVLISALVCTCTDIILMSIGVVGFGGIFNLHPALVEISKWLGATFLIVYGFMAFKSAIRPKTLQSFSQENSKVSKKRIIWTFLGLGLLNPHAYLDSIVLIGSIAAQHYGVKRYIFGLGAITASAIWFFSVAYGARVLTPLFRKQSTWRVLDILIGCTMLFVALLLIF